MELKPKVLGVIPARGGSKGVPKKNIKDLKGKPLISYSIEEARRSKLMDRCIVSTDSEEIAKVSKEAGGDVPFIRPNEFATDMALSVDVIKHALNFLKEQGEEYDIVVLLQPTTPFRTAEDIDKAIEKIIKTDCDSVVSMVDVGANHPARMYTLEEADQLESVMEEGITMRPRQELPPIYIRSGDVYASKVNSVFSKNSMMGKDCRAIVIPEKRAVNIDTLLDFKMAEIIIEDLHDS